MIEGLIDKVDSFEQIRDQIAGILAAESVSQQALAVTAGKDPDDWKLRVYTERSNPWETWLNNSDDRSPLVNVWYDSSVFDGTAGDVVSRQKTTGVYNIDCYGLGVAADEPGGGHKPGDRESAFEVARCLRLARNILMASDYTYLGLRGLVWQRWPESITSFQPEIDNRALQKITGARIAFRVVFNEFSPQAVPVDLDIVFVTIDRALDGQILVEAEYDYT